MGERIELRIPLTREQAQALTVLGYIPAGGSSPLHGIVSQLLRTAVEGVQRPGSWERGWLLQAFGNAWEEGLEPDPAATWKQRPTRKALRR
jgi:hypothetical protein